MFKYHEFVQSNLDFLNLKNASEEFNIISSSFKDIKEKVIQSKILEKVNYEKIQDKLNEEC